MPKYQLTPDSIPLLLKLPVPIEREEVVAIVEAESGIARPRLESMLQALLDAGIVETETGSTAQASAYSYSFGKLVNHRSMLSDTARTDAFRAAIEAVVRPGDTVIDVGSGSGILSFFAARAGAKKVFGLETTKLVEDARKLAEVNGLADRVEFVECDAATFQAPGKVDVVLGEWVGMFLLDEWRHFEAFAKVRAANLKPGGAVLPCRVRLYLSPVSDTGLYMEHGLGFWEKPLHGLDFTLGRARQIESLRMATVRANRYALIGEPWQILDLDCAAQDAAAYSFESAAETRCPSTMTCHGYVGYFTLDLAPGVSLDTSPLSLQTHWHQVYFPIEAFHMEPGDLLRSHAATSRKDATDAPLLTIAHELVRGGKTVREGSYTYPVGERRIG
jgi:2-polyprenyl-3-methyl-5-hydroxy-6-metoxy-1,4-benzoquinol methylase